MGVEVVVDAGVVRYGLCGGRRGCCCWVRAAR